MQPPAHISSKGLPEVECCLGCRGGLSRKPGGGGAVEAPKFEGVRGPIFMAMYKIRVF